MKNSLGGGKTGSERGDVDTEQPIDPNFVREEADSLTPAGSVESIRAILRANLSDIRRRIEEACRRASRGAGEIVLVAVAKSVDVETAKILMELGQQDFGESRPQELWKKEAEAPNARWHFIGHLQTNKVRRTLPKIALLHSMDRWELLEEISEECERSHLVIEGCLEVKLTSEAAKHGFEPAQVGEVYQAAKVLPGVRIVGLMGMAALDASNEDARSSFRQLRLLRDRLRTDEARLPVLSMGMSSDFEAAVEEGATHLRIGSALFEGLPAPEPRT